MRIFPGLVVFFLTQLSLLAGELKPVVPSAMLEEIDAAEMEESLWERINSKETPSTGDMQEGISLSKVIWNAKLLQVYVRLSASLSATAAQELAEEQRAWMKERDETAEESGEFEEGGSAQSLEEGSTFIEETKKRVKVLEKRLGIGPEAHAADWVLGAFKKETSIEGRKASKFISVEITQKNGLCTLSGGAGYNDGSSAAPDFGGSLILSKDGMYRFDFEDSFFNKGEVIVTKDEHGICIDINVEEVKDARCLPHYGKRTLERVKE